jgi:hypothetical protein
MATEGLSGIGEAIRKASEAYVEALSTVGKALQDIAAQSMAGADRERVVDNWLRVARMSKDGVVSALEQGFELWEREVRRAVETSKGGHAPRATNPMEAWAENWRKATEAFAGSGWSEEARKQAAMVQSTLQEGLRAWQRLWEPEKKS